MQDVINEVSTTDSGRGDLANQYKVLDTIIEDSLKDGLPYDGCGALHVIDHAHHEIHEGDYIFGDDISGSLASGDIKYWLFITPDEATYYHSFPHIIGTGEFEVQSYEGVTVATNGTEIPMYNRNRNIAIASTYKFYKDPTTPNVTNCPIVRNIRIGSGKSAIGESRAENELILKPNTKYLIKATSRAVGTFITCHLNGYVCGIGAST
jgi:hypothetical protein